MPERRRQRFADCGCNAWCCLRDDEPVIVTDTCHDRWCVPCQVQRRAALQAAVAHKVKTSGECRMLTLTRRSLARHKLPDLLERLGEAWRKLRQRKWWKEHVTGGVICWEIKRGEKGNWHPHLHIICAGKRIKHKELSDEWFAVTGDSFVVWVTPIPETEKGASDAAFYVTKYATKPMDVTALKAADLAVAMVALKGKRLVQTFGDWVGIDAEDDDPNPGPLRKLCPLDSLFNPDNRRWLEAFTRKYPDHPLFTAHPTLGRGNDPAP